MKKQIRILAAAVLVAMAPAPYAQTTTLPSGKNAGQNLVANKIASNFGRLAGGEDNALALVNALRSGGEVTLVTSVPPPAGSPTGTLPTTTETTFAVPTKPMGWGNVKHSLSLAQDQLTRAGITNPTAAQLQTALTGGDLVATNADGTTTTTSVKGVLTMRADGMGWGNIAKEGGTRLGQVRPKVDMSANTVKSTTSTTATTTAAGSTAKSGVVTAAGGASATGPKASKGLVTAGGPSASASPNGNAYGRGIVTGAGGSATNVAAASHGKGAGVSTGAGVVTGGGSSAGSGITHGGGGSSNAGGNGKGQGGGNGKGKGG